MMKGSSRFQFILRVDGVDAVDTLKAIDTVEATERADWRIIFKMKLDEHMLLWNQAAVKLLDIRHMIMNPSERLEQYLLPYSVRGSARLRLDGMQQEANHFLLLLSALTLFLTLKLNDEQYAFAQKWLHEEAIRFSQSYLINKRPVSLPKRNPAFTLVPL
ncbi:hypothetical protein [Paenibacillus paridis]|uniref:hypothetical protein n=1 Tax=Paenibacillus paridis TaxID=2583376 RepID=UPI00111F018B|nr:hypothetical protein [Paenibacillus paridis]